MTHPRPTWRGPASLAVLSLALLAACSSPPPAPAPLTTPTTPSPTPSVTITPIPTPSPTRVRLLPSLKGDPRNAFAFAPLSDPDDITVEGSTGSAEAWSTSKVLVVLAFIEQVAGGDPDRLTAEQDRLIKLALTESDLDALLTLRGQIPGGSGAPATAMLRAVGDNQTVVPDTGEGSMQWSLRNQIKFLTALHEGKVVSKRASAYVVDNMRPVPSESWGLGSVGSTAFKGGWLTPDSVTRQMGFLDGYAVAILTDGVGPAPTQIDGDQAHVQQLNRLARKLERRLAAERLAADS